MNVVESEQPAPNSDEYRMVWSSPDGFAVWESVDGKLIQFTGPDGQVLSQLSRHGS